MAKDSPTVSHTRGRRVRDRARTESDLLDAAFDLFQRDGIFAGLNLQEVADRAGVNRGQIYQYFGDGRSLLRSAVAARAREWAAGAKRHWAKPFAQRRAAMFRSALTRPETTFVEAVLALDGDPDYHVLPEIERTRAALERDLRTGALPPGTDAIAMHAFMVAAYKGYLIFRVPLARDIGTTVQDLDQRVLDAHDAVIDALVKKQKQRPGPASKRADE